MHSSAPRPSRSRKTRRRPVNDPLVVLTTVESREQAESIARLLVEDALAACVQIVGPVTSIYRWQGRVETAGELLLLIKTRSGIYPDLERKIRENHPYQTPEILALPVQSGFEGYLSWLIESTQKL
ncbi:MAG: divalent-cation tolerance protein CutA [Acidobacteriota bacterium]|nr:MAG: divalent-cation tolerance protein CutA [Acidobacteriota bacterium]